MGVYSLVTMLYGYIVEDVDGKELEQLREEDYAYSSDDGYHGIRGDTYIVVRRMLDDECTKTGSLEYAGGLLTDEEKARGLELKRQAQEKYPTLKLGPLRIALCVSWV